MIERHGRAGARPDGAGQAPSALAAAVRSDGATQRISPKPPCPAQPLAARTFTFASASLRSTSAAAPARFCPWTKSACLRAESFRPALSAARVSASASCGTRSICVFPPTPGKAVKLSRSTPLSLSPASTRAPSARLVGNIDVEVVHPADLVGHDLPPWPLCGAGASWIHGAALPSARLYTASRGSAPTLRSSLDGRRTPARFRGGSASGSGDRPGLQNRWRAMRVVLGGFDSHALPPPKTEREQGVAPRHGSGRSGPLGPSRSVLCRHVPPFSGTSAAHGMSDP